MRRVDSATAAAVTLLALTSAYFVIDNYVPLYPWNNLTEAGPQLGSTLSMVIPYTVTAAALLARWRWPAVFMAGYCWVLLALQIATWYPPYLFGTSAAWYRVHGYEKTTKLLPRIDNHDVVVDAQHNVLQLLTLGTAVAVTLATARLWRGCRTS
ncbi:MAG TPA: hypothetical protein VK735_34910 [Pseudonocardia sp.]|jgi:hypothetical protein|uniref:hypothetical protein n=1 Tax=Pseudonocardia sp. TaxID=60912 RepID=UPI002C55FAEA|nr:hypothetical protein [Pseudonocardia sp.]HTF52668.1 hypothetical protein [Pseudonocardia sp.]